MLGMRAISNSSSEACDLIHRCFHSFEFHGDMWARLLASCLHLHRSIAPLLRPASTLLWCAIDVNFPNGLRRPFQMQGDLLSKRVGRGQKIKVNGRVRNRGSSVRPGQVYYFSSFLTLKKTSFALFGIPVLSCFKLRSSTLLQGILADLQEFPSKPNGF